MESEDHHTFNIKYLLTLKWVFNALKNSWLICIFCEVYF